MALWVPCLHWAILEWPIGGLSGLELRLSYGLLAAGFPLDIHNFHTGLLFDWALYSSSRPEMAAMVAFPLGAYSSYDLEKTSFVGSKVANPYPILGRILGIIISAFPGYLDALYIVSHDGSPK